MDFSLTIQFPRKWKHKKQLDYTSDPLYPGLTLSSPITDPLQARNLVVYIRPDINTIHYVELGLLTYLLLIETARFDKSGVVPTHRKKPPLSFITWKCITCSKIFSEKLCTVMASHTVPFCGTLILFHSSWLWLATAAWTRASCNQLLPGQRYKAVQINRSSMFRCAKHCSHPKRSQPVFILRTIRCVK